MIDLEKITEEKVSFDLENKTEEKVKKRKRKKLPLIILIVALIFAVFISLFYRSNSRIESHFYTFANMFPTEDLSTLKDDNLYNSTTTRISSRLTTKTEKGSKSVYVSLDTEDLKGRIHITIDENSKSHTFSYPVYYDKNALYLDEEKIDESINAQDEDINSNEYINLEEELTNYVMPLNFLSIGEDYLNSLKGSDHSYVFEDFNYCFYEVDYKLNPDDKNIQKLKEFYPTYSINPDNVFLRFNGFKVLMQKANTYDLTIYLDDNFDNYLIISLESF